MPEWMIVYTTHDITEAHIVAGRLEVEGIKVLIQRQPVAEAYGFTMGRLGEVNVAVSSRDYEKALEILEPDELYALSDNDDEIVYYDYHSDDDDDTEQNTD